MSRTSQGRQLRQPRNSKYVYGATAEDFIRELDEAPKKAPNQKVKENRERARRMDLPYVMFLAAALAACAITLINYVRLQAEITENIDEISKLENKYVSAKIKNDEEYDRIINSVDLDNVKKVAIEQLGMHYATEGQIITYTDDMRDYVRLYSDVEE